MAYTIVDFAKSLQVDRCRIVSTPQIIFLCGGKLATSGPYKSARDFFNRHVQKRPTLAARVRLAESVNAWFKKDEAFPDLLELEKHLAHLADLTVLFVESAGSIAELGAFAASEPFRGKMLVVISDAHDTERTFIADGPIRRIRKDDTELVQVYTWDGKSLNTTKAKRELKEMTEELISVIENRDVPDVKRSRFDANRIDHVLLLLTDLIGIARVASMSELADCLREMECNIDGSELDRHLSVLQSVDLIKQRLRSHQVFYVTNSPRLFFKYGYRHGTSVKDLTRIKTLIRQGMDSKRKAILRNTLSESSGKS